RMGPARRARPRRHRGLRLLPGWLPPRPRRPAPGRLAGLGLRAVGPPRERRIPARPRRAAPPGGADRRDRRGGPLRRVPPPTRPRLAGRWARLLEVGAPRS